VDASHGQGTQVGDSNFQYNNNSVGQTGYQNIQAGKVKVINRRLAIRLPGFTLQLSLGQLVLAVLTVTGLAGGGAVAATAIATPNAPAAAVPSASAVSVVDLSVGEWKNSGPITDTTTGSTAQSVDLTISSGFTYNELILGTTVHGTPGHINCGGDVSARGTVLVLTPFQTQQGDSSCVTITATIDGQVMTFLAGTPPFVLHRV
jgi:hypothetical protein